MNVVPKLLLLPILLAGCVQDDSPSNSFEAAEQAEHVSGFADVDASGAIDVVLKDRIDGGYDDDAGNGFAYAAGINDAGAYATYASILPGTSTAALPTTGTASFRGAYEYIEIGNVGPDGTSAIGATAERHAGRITLDADFANGTLESSAASGVQVDARFGADQNLTGTVKIAIYSTGSDGVLNGKIGGDKVVAAFHGKTQVFSTTNSGLHGTSYAGGIYATADP